MTDFSLFEQNDVAFSGLITLQTHLGEDRRFNARAIPKKQLRRRELG